ncbi:MAG TPA: hypothetical protein VH720_05325 [Candidatus Limnocylindrales bacterium]|jgi:tetratricopeptide (TPR) repeat protein
MTDPGVDAAPRRLARRLEDATRAADVDELLRVAQGLAEAGCRWAAAEVVQDALSAAPDRSEVHAAVVRIYRAAGWHQAAGEHDRLLARYSEIVDHAAELDALADRALAAGDVRGLVDVAARHARRDRYQPALEACYEALRLAPTDPGVHLELARIRLALGWRVVAVDHLQRLGRLLDLAGDVAGRERVDEFLANELDGERGPSTAMPS